MSGISDARIAWIQRRVLLGLGVDETEFEHMLDNPGSAVNEAATSAADILRDYLGVKTGVGSSLFFHVEMENVEESEEYDEEYQESEPVEGEQQPDGESYPSPEAEGDPTPHADSNDGKSAPSTKPPSDDGMGSQTEGSKALDAAPEEAAGETSNTGDVQANVSEARVVTKTRKVVRTVQTTKRRCRVTRGNLPDSSDRVVYFVKIMGGEVDSPASCSDHGSMATVMEYGCLAGDCLTNLSAVIKDVFAPLLDHQLGLGVLAAAATGGGDKVSPEVTATVPQDAPKVGDNLRNEFRANLHKFESQVTHATQQVKGDVHLSVPNINIDDPDIGNDFEAVSLLESAMEEWSRLISAVVEAENLKRVKGKGPMAEIEFWRRRNASLSALYEQINMPKVILWRGISMGGTFLFMFKR